MDLMAKEIRNPERRVAKLYEEIGVLEISEKCCTLRIWYPLGTKINYWEEMKSHEGSAERIKCSNHTLCFFYRKDNLIEIKKGRFYTKICFPSGTKPEFDTDTGQALV